MSTLPITGQKRLNIALLIVSAALAALLVDEWQQATALRGSVLALKSRQAATPPALKLEPPFRLQPPSSYARITEQSSFVASRTGSGFAATQPAKSQKWVATVHPRWFLSEMNPEQR